MAGHHGDTDVHTGLLLGTVDTLSHILRLQDGLHQYLLQWPDSRAVVIPNFSCLPFCIIYSLALAATITMHTIARGRNNAP